MTLVTITTQRVVKGKKIDEKTTFDSNNVNEIYYNTSENLLLILPRGDSKYLKIRQCSRKVYTKVLAKLSFFERLFFDREERHQFECALQRKVDHLFNQKTGKRRIIIFFTLHVESNVKIIRLCVSHHSICMGTCDLAFPSDKFSKKDYESHFHYVLLKVCDVIVKSKIPESYYLPNSDKGKSPREIIRNIAMEYLLYEELKNVYSVIEGMKNRANFIRLISFVAFEDTHLRFRISQIN